MIKILSKIGMLFHRHNDFWDVSCDPNRIAMECKKCGTIWGWDR